MFWKLSQHGMEPKRGATMMFGLGVSIAFWALMPGSASAEGNCPAGHYPTYGVDGSGKQIQTGCYPVYDPNPPSNGPNSPSSNEPVRLRNLKGPSSYVTVVTHPYARDVWATWNAPRDYHSQNAALAACRKVMGDDGSEAKARCLPALSMEMGTIVVAKEVNNNDNIVMMPGKTAQKARDKLLALCAKENRQCEIMHEFTTNRLKPERTSPYLMPGQEMPPTQMQHYVPDVATLIKPEGLVHSAMSYTKSPHAPWGTKLWFSGGHVSGEVAGRAANAKCQQDSQWDCTAWYFRDFDVFVAMTPDRVHFFNWGYAREKALDLLKARCQEAGKSCTGGVQFNSLKQGTTVVDLAAAPVINR